MSYEGCVLQTCQYLVLLFCYESCRIIYSPPQTGGPKQTGKAVETRSKNTSKVDIFRLIVLIIDLDTVSLRSIHLMTTICHGFAPP